MSPYDAARHRLENAVARLESVLVGLGGPRPEEARISSALSAARAESVALKEAAETVAARLDAVIDRLKAVLEEE